MLIVGLDVPEEVKDKEQTGIPSAPIPKTDGAKKPGRPKKPVDK